MSTKYDKNNAAVIQHGVSKVTFAPTGFQIVTAATVFVQPQEIETFTTNGEYLTASESVALTWV